MDNGTNDWSVSYSTITYFEGMLGRHNNVAGFVRSRDIMFAVTRKKPPDCVHVLIVNRYTFGAADFYRARAEFPEVTCISLAGGWSAYTLEAKELANEENIGLLLPRELYAAIWQEEPNKYFSKDSRGNPIYHVRSTA